jgi:hypothetical protein
MSIELPTREVSANDFAYIMFIRTIKERAVDDKYVEELIRNLQESFYDFPIGRSKKL